MVGKVAVLGSTASEVLVIARQVARLQLPS
jgi:hypothetical protein